MTRAARPAPAVEAADLLRDTTHGRVRGVHERGVVAWRGMPFAAPPTGPRRFRAPAPAQPWRGVRDAAHFGPAAPQDRGQFVGVDATTPTDEDCLTINVVAPEGSRPGDDLPVLVYVHGGAYSVGSSREHPRHGEALVREGGIVYVSFNYRLGAFGYLDFTAWSTPERPLESNLGLRDQVAALEWVRDEVRAFGGDPGAVTLSGESSGGNAVTTLMTVPAARGLFHRAIAQSSPTNALYPPDVTRRWAGEFLELLTHQVSDDDLESTSVEDAGRMLAEAPVAAVVRASAELQLRTPDEQPGTISLSPVIDGDFLPERPLDAFKAGRAHPVPLIIGTNDREGSVFTGRRDILATTKPRIRAIFAATEKKSRKAIKRQYPGLPADRRAALDFGGDFAFWFPTVKVAERHAVHQPVYFYRFDAAPRMLAVAGVDAFHGLELMALHDRMGSAFGWAMSALGGRRAFLRTAARMRARWIEFVRTGEVDGWPPYDPFRRRTLIIDARDRVEHDPRGERRRAWQAFVPHI
ncbi:para-nitrobenzyl esterase [Frigoribacterium sp. PvP120]|uniref:carboxylesterase/lipase family protein n=1 Tax=unclassified Frigoribacterium TaxID=2627005 RepID=UPI00177E0074|nr:MULTISPECIES: carboxylesterase/lipase family protein [unclassified Frigoribacterium]MBD8659904.1 carboxylesterase/lipase family protein [Frigoribacterium sp. CFBP 8754]MBD8728633.1 carboxylesterase/lipase family protein [Frigoribacterium sp. CFBP 13707]MBP1242247.1 para-nitrobenzyl esterase [Frigoribacterium sp. PvP121]